MEPRDWITLAAFVVQMIVIAVSVSRSINGLRVQLARSEEREKAQDRDLGEIRKELHELKGGLFARLNDYGERIVRLESKGGNA